MRLPALIRTTPFRLTLLFMALFAGAASAFLAFIYVVGVSEVTHFADGEVMYEASQLDKIYDRDGRPALVHTINDRSSGDDFYYLLQTASGARLAGDIKPADVGGFERGAEWLRATIDSRGPGKKRGRWPARINRMRLAGGETLFVATDVSEPEAYVLGFVRTLWAAGGIVILLGMAGGVIVARNVNRSVGRLNEVVSAVQGGDLRARVALKGTGDEFDDLAAGLNDMLDRLERSIGGLRHAGDAIAHDLRSPLTRLRTRLEVALLDVEAGRGDPKAALAQALEDADAVLRTFNTVLAIARLQAAGSAPDQAVFDPTHLAADIAELYQPLAEERGQDFTTELAEGLAVRGNREFIAQAMANILDNAVKYNAPKGAVMLRVRRRSSGEIEFSVTDTGPGVPEADRARVAQRFVRLENSRSLPGVGLGLSLVMAVAQAHGGRLEIDEGPGKVGDIGPGLRVALVLPRAG